MHSFEGKRCIIHHNNDLHEHEVCISTESAERPIWIPLSDLLDFVGGLLRDQRIADLEQMRGRDFLLPEVKR